MHFTEMYIERRTLSIIPIPQNSYKNLSFINCLTRVFLILQQFKGAQVLYYYYYLKLMFSTASAPNFQQMFMSKLQNKPPKKYFSAKTQCSTYCGNMVRSAPEPRWQSQGQPSPVQNTDQCVNSDINLGLYFIRTSVFCVQDRPEDYNNYYNKPSQIVFC